MNIQTGYTSKTKNHNNRKNIIDDTCIINNNNMRRITNINYTLNKDYTIKNSPSQLPDEPIL